MNSSENTNFGAIGNRVYTNKVRLRGLGEREEGQVIELDASLIKDDEALFKILIRDGFQLIYLAAGR